MIDAIHLTGLDWLPPLMLAIALTAWALAFAGLVTTTLGSWRRRPRPAARKVLSCVVAGGPLRHL